MEITKKSILILRKKKLLNINCESSIVHAFFSSKIMFYINLFLVSILIYFSVIEKKYFFLSFILMTIFISLFHLTHENPAFYLFSAIALVLDNRRINLFNKKL